MPKLLSLFRPTKFIQAVLFVLVALQTSSAFADGIPEAWGIGLQSPGSPIESRVYNFHNFLLWVTAAICIFVLLLMIFIVLRYNKWANPNPSDTTHNVKLEFVWTLIPCLILAVIAYYSFPLLYYADREPPPDLTLKVTGHQWYWSYEYPDNGDVTFDSHAIWDSSDVTDDQAKKLIADNQMGWLVKNTPMRMLEVDNRLVLPVGKNVRVQITASDVEHSWYINSLGINRMAVPGRLNQLWLKVDKPGIYYGQCSMICGNGHGYMPIVIEAVSPEVFATWVQSKAPKTSQIAPSTSIATAQ